MKAFRTLLKTELKLSLRGMDMVIFAIFLPLAALLLLAAIYGDQPAYPGAEYTFLQQSFSALCTISICAGGVMGLPLVIADLRSKKILKRFFVTPIGPGLILCVHVAVYLLYALASLGLLTLAAVTLFGYRMEGSILGFLGSYLLVMASLFSVGIMVGGLARNAQAAGVIASVLYFPMLLFSGATLPYEAMPSALQKVADVLPLTQGIKLLKATSLGLPVESAAIPIAVILVIAVVCTVISLRCFKWE